MIVGFTGSSKRVTKAQLRSLAYWLDSEPITVVRHGDCVAADEAFDALCAARGIIRHAHPGHDRVGLTPARAHCPVDVVHPPKPYLERNKTIVAYCDVLLACPDGRERLRSGTWSTVRYAVRVGRPVAIIMPDGTVESR